MATVLVVDDMAIFRDLVTTVLRQVGYQALGAASGADAARLVRNSPPDLILLDVAMPGMDGLKFLEQLRKCDATAETPVILLTATADKQCVLMASKLKARDYLLKSAFSLDELLARVQKHAPLPQAPAPELPGETAVSSPPPPAAFGARAADERLQVNRKDCVRRAMDAMPVKTLGGVVAEVLSVAASPRGDLSHLAAMISQDMTLSARVLQAANSAAYAAAHGPVTSIHDAVWTIGSSSVRNIAVSLGIYEAMPKNSPDGFNPVLCWQHSLAVAQLCEHLCAQWPATNVGTGYLVGLCHDLGELLFREHFGPEFRAVLECQRKSGRPRADIEREILGMTHGELVQIILQHFGLPAAIRSPIEQFHSTPSGADAPLVRVLRLADTYADSLLLAATPMAGIMPFTKAQCRGATGRENPVAPESQSFCCQIVALTCLLAKMGRNEEKALNQPLYPRAAARVWLARDGGLSEFDPVGTALDLLADIAVHDRLPSIEECGQVDGLVAVARSPAIAGFEQTDLARVAAAGAHRKFPILWLVGLNDKSMPAVKEVSAPTLWPMPLCDLAAFVKEIIPAAAAAA